MKLNELIETCSEPVYTVHVHKDNVKLMSFYDKEMIAKYVGNRDIAKWFSLSSNGELDVELKDNYIASIESEDRADEVVFTTDSITVRKKEVLNKDFLEMLPTQDPHKYDDYDIRNLRLGKAALNKLSNLGISTVGELRELTVENISSIPRIGKRRVDDIRRALYEFNCHLKDDENYKPHK